MASQMMAPCTHSPISKEGDPEYDEDFDFPCEFSHSCHICGPNLLYCQYQIANQCFLCGQEYCSQHVCIEDHIAICSQCFNKN